jgi:hypothetical protein
MSKFRAFRPRRLPTATAKQVVASRSKFEVAKVKIAEAGRRALREHGSLWRGTAPSRARGH